MTLSDNAWRIIFIGLATAVVGLMGGQIDYGIRANALTRTGPVMNEARAGLRHTVTVPFAGDAR